MTFGHALRAYRSRLGLSQSALAVRVGVDQSHISKVERGKVTPLVTFAKRLSDELGVTVDEMLDFEGHEEVAA